MHGNKFDEVDFVEAEYEAQKAQVISEWQRSQKSLASIALQYLTAAVRPTMVMLESVWTAKIIAKARKSLVSVRNKKYEQED